MRRLSKGVICAAFALASASGAFAAAEQARIVSVGSRLPGLAELKKNIAHYEGVAPFDGVMIHVGLSDVFRAKKFSDGERDRAKANGKLYRQIRFERWKYNFLGVLIDQHRPEWFDDGYWESVAANWGLAAKFARQLGMAGICFDPEGYGVYPVQSHWKSAWWVKGGGKLKGGGVQPPDERHTVEDYRAVARKRGQQVGEAVFREFPDMVLWGYYLWSFNADLMGEFCNGLLEAMPPKARLVDGDEWNGYCAKGEGDYERMERRNKTGGGFLDKKLAAKHMKQGGFAPAFYLDAYAWPEKSGCLTPAIGRAKSKIRFFRDNLKEARRKATGGHVWIYGEKCTWFPPPPDESPPGARARATWEETMPGIGAALFGDRLASCGRKDRGGRK